MAIWPASLRWIALGVIGLLAGSTLVAEAQPFDSKAASAILIDVDSGMVLFRKAETAKFQPAAMAKMMTIAVVFDRLKSGKLKLDDSFTVSEHAWRTGGAPSGSATMFAALKSSISVSDLLRGAIVQAGNDACIILAEGISGSDTAFVEEMNRKARELGMADTHFANVTGLPDPQQLTTAADLAKLAAYLIETFPDYYKIYAEPDFTWNKIYQRNRNPLLGDTLGADGLSTGFTPESGYGLAASALRDGHRAILVISGLATDKDRADEARKLLDWGNSNFERLRFFEPGETVGMASVFNGAAGEVALAAHDPVDLLLARGQRDRIRARISYSGPLIAPVQPDTEVGKLQVYVGDDLAVQRPVYTTAAVAVGTMQQRAIDGATHLLIGWLPSFK